MEEAERLAAEQGAQPAAQAAASQGGLTDIEVDLPEPSTPEGEAKCNIGSLERAVGKAAEAEAAATLVVDGHAVEDTSGDSQLAAYLWRWELQNAAAEEERAASGSADGSGGAAASSRASDGAGAERRRRLPSRHEPRLPRKKRRTECPFPHFRTPSSKSSDAESSPIF